MSSSYFNFIVCLGFTNAFVFAFVLIIRFKKTLADKFLASILIILGLICAKILLHTIGLWQHSFFRYFPLGIDLWLPPFLWLYVLALSEPKRLNYSIYAYHLFLPIIFEIYAILIYVITFPENSLRIKDSLAHQLWFNQIKSFEDILSLIFGIYYGLLSISQLKKYQSWVKKFITETGAPTHNWLRNLLFATALVLSLLGIMLISIQLNNNAIIPLQIFYIYLVFVIYIFAFFGFRHNDFKLSQVLINRKSEVLSNIQLMDLIRKLDNWMYSTKPFLESDLNLHQCAKAMDCSTIILSDTINIYKKQNFREYINALRIDAFKDALLRADLKKETIMGIAYKCGFNTEASLYRIFKESTGQTPKQFLKSQILITQK